MDLPTLRLFFVINMKTNVVVGASLPHKLLRPRGMYVPYKFGYFLLEPRAYGCVFKVDEVEPSISEISKIDPKPCCSGFLLLLLMFLVLW